MLVNEMQTMQYPFSDLLIDSLPLGIVFQNLQGEIEKANPAAESILGLSLAQMRGVQSIDPRWQAIHEDETPFPGDSHPAMVALKTQKPVHNVIMGIENPMQNERTWISVSAFPARHENGNIAGVYAIFKDITAKVHAQQSEKEADELLRSSIEAMTEGMAIHRVIYDSSGTPKDYLILDVNSSYEKQTGLTKQSTVGQLASVIYGTGNAPFLDVFARVADTQKPTKFDQYFAPLKKHFLINVFSSKKGQFVTVFEDISDLKASAEALYQSEERLRAITDNVNAVMFMKDREGRYLHVNHHFEKLFHLTKSEIIGKTDHEIFPPEMANSFFNNDRAVIQSGQPIEVEELVQIEAGERTFVSVKFPIRNVSGEIYAVSGIATDITERKNSELALQDSEARYRRFAEELPLGVLITQGGLTKYVNPALLKMIGYAKEELLEKPFIPFVFNEDQAWLIDLHRRRMMGEHIESPYVVRMVCKNGDTREWRMHTNTIMWNGKPSGLGITEDITEQMKTEKKLHESFQLLEEKEMAKTRFLAAAGHDLRQPLAAANLFIDALKFTNPNPEQEQCGGLM